MEDDKGIVTTMPCLKQRSWQEKQNQLYKGRKWWFNMECVKQDQYNALFD